MWGEVNADGEDFPPLNYINTKILLFYLKYGII